MSHRSKPPGYLLPWCEALNCAYWQVNLALCFVREGWREWQSRKDMREIITRIDEMIAQDTLRSVNG